MRFFLTLLSLPVFLGLFPSGFLWPHSSSFCSLSFSFTTHWNSPLIGLSSLPPDWRLHATSVIFGAMPLCLAQWLANSRHLIIVCWMSVGPHHSGLDSLRPSRHGFEPEAPRLRSSEDLPVLLYSPSVLVPTGSPCSAFATWLGLTLSNEICEVKVMS